MKKVVITGATSMMGIAVINSLLSHDVERIYAVVQLNSQRIGRIPRDDRITIIQCSCEEYKNLANLINDSCDAFYHFAWINSANSHNKRYFDVDVAYKNIGYTLQAFDAAVNLNVKKFIGAGSQAEYGSARKPIQSPTDPVDPITTYAIAKDTVRRLLEIKSQENNILLLWVRIFSVYGVYDRDNTMISSVLKKMLTNIDIDLTECAQTWDYLFEEDAGDALYCIAKNSNKSKIYCLGSGNAKKLKDYIFEMKLITNSTSKLNFGTIPYEKGSVLELNADITDLKKCALWSGPKIAFEDGIKKIIKKKYQ